MCREVCGFESLSGHHLPSPGGPTAPGLFRPSLVKASKAKTQSRKAARPAVAEPGTVYLVGAGPGDPDLMTRRAEALVRQADVVVYDYLVQPEVLAWCRPDAQKIYVGKQAGMHARPQAEIEQLLLEKARTGVMVVRLKGGDPLVFGRGGEEARALANAGVPFEIVPGVTAALAAAAAAGIPLTHREQSSAVAFLTGHEDPEKHTFRVDFCKAAGWDATLAIYMGVGQLPRIVAELQEGGREPDTPAAAIQWASLPNQRTVRAPLAQLPEAVKQAGLGTPAMILVGPAVAVGDGLDWFARRPLAGRRVVVTRSLDQAGELTAQLRSAGADVIELPMIRIEAEAGAQWQADVWDGLTQYDWVVFTSVNGVRHFFELFYQKHSDLRSIGGVRFAAVGPTTAGAVQEQKLEVDLVPAQANAEALADALIAHASMDNLKVLLVTGNRNRDVLRQRLEEERAIVDELAVYRNEPADLEGHPGADRFRSEGADAVVFASSSAVEGFVAQAGILQRDPGTRTPACVSIGPQTSAALRAAGLPVDFEAQEATVASLVSGLAGFFARTAEDRR